MSQRLHRGQHLSHAGLRLPLVAYRREELAQIGRWSSPTARAGLLVRAKTLMSQARLDLTFVERELGTRLAALPLYYALPLY